MPRHGRPAGYTLVELLLVIAIATTVAAITAPVAEGTVDRLRTAAAARYMAARIAAARLEALRRSTTVALRFQRSDGGHVFVTYVDGNANGLRTLDVTQGVDRAVTPPERLSDQFPGTAFGLLPGVPDLDGGTGSTEGVRIGSSLFLSLSPDGSATSGTLYVHGRRSQYAVRVLGATGRVRFFSYDAGARRWITR